MYRLLRFAAVFVLVFSVAYYRRTHQQHASAPALTKPTTSSAPRLPTLPTLTDARSKHPTRLTSKVTDGDAVEVPPADVFDVVHYPAAPGPLAAYVTPDPHDGRRHPAIVWLHGGGSNSIGEAWHAADRTNDQTGAQFRSAGIVLMLPSLRGGNDDPGFKERFYGEVDDAVAAGRYLAGLPWVDPKRVYLAGHSTGGTLALLVSESTDEFRAVFCFGPVANPKVYGKSMGPWPFDANDKMEFALRAPGVWLASVRSPTFVLEGADKGNAVQVKWMRDRATELPALHWAIVPGKSHFSILAPANELIAQKILDDTGPMPNIEITAADVASISSH